MVTCHLVGVAGDPQSQLLGVVCLRDPSTSAWHVVAVGTAEGVAFGFCFLQAPHSAPLSSWVIATSPVDWSALYTC